MAKKKPAKKAKANQGLGFSKLSEFKKFLLHHKTLGILLIIVGIWALVWLGQAGVERYNFYRVEKTMDSITGQINSRFNVLNEHKARACGTRDEAFGSHLGGCSITYYYEVSADKNSKDTAQEIDKMIQKRKDVSIWSPNPTLYNNIAFKLVYKINPVESDTYYSSYKLNSIKNPACEVKYYLNGKKGSVFKIYFSCFLTGRDAKFPYFPIQN